MTKPLSIAMIIQSYYPRIGGAERQIETIAPLLRSRGVRVDILTRRYPGMKEFEEIDGFPVYRLPVPGPKPVASISFTLFALALLRRLRPDVIHAHELFSPTTTAVAAKRVYGIPVVATPHLTGINGDVERLKRKAMGAQRIAIFRQEVDVFVCINREIEADLAGVGIPAERRLIIPNGVSTKHLAPVTLAEKRSLRVSLGLPDAPILVFTGRLVRSKRVDLLIGIWPAIRACYPQAELVIVGSGPEEEALRSSATAGVRFVAAVQEVAPYLQAADLFVSASSEEGLSVSILEAMAANLPVIATAVGGNPGLIKSGTNGWLIPPNDPAALQTAVVRLLGDPNARAVLGRAAREHVTRNYDLSVTAQALHELYEQVKRKAGQPASAVSEVSG